MAETTLGIQNVENHKASRHLTRVHNVVLSLHDVPARMPAQYQLMLHKTQRRMKDHIKGKLDRWLFVACLNSINLNYSQCSLVRFFSICTDVQLDELRCSHIQDAADATIHH
mgnify:CR=1 FL=1